MKLESLDLNLLLVFEALATECSVTRAATKIGLSQPALSNALARLRILFRDPLFERSGGQMQPTPRARQLLPPLSEAIAKLRETFETQAAFRPEVSEREFLIATNDYIDALLLPRLVQKLQREAPSIGLRAVRTDYLFLAPVKRLQSGELDLALRLRSARGPSGRRSQIWSAHVCRNSARSRDVSRHGADREHRHHPAQSRPGTADRRHRAALCDDPRYRGQIKSSRRRARGVGASGSAFAPTQNLRPAAPAARHHRHDDLECPCAARPRPPLVARMHCCGVRADGRIA